ncbi:MAG: aminotransferase class V-fold PLP-dependent enzyme [Rikenellaceae bacterium]
MEKRNGYFDNAATSHPKSESVIHAINHYLQRGGTYGRVAYDRAVENTRMVERCRMQIARLIGCPESDRVVFSANATWAANAILQRFGFQSGDIVYHSGMEHNAVMRPLTFLEQSVGIVLRQLPSDQYGVVDMNQLYDMDLSDARLVVINHASNINGVVQPLWSISRELPQGVELFVDASQSLGAVDINVEEMGIDYMIFTGHKSLGGVTGVGGYYSRRDLEGFVFGGTGSRSDSYLMPEESPDRYEAGTPNLVGLAALYAAVCQRVEPRHSRRDFVEMIESLRLIGGLTIYCARALDGVELFSFTHERLTPSQIADRLSQEFDIDVRQGLHCAPLAHRTLGTFADGTVRVSLSPFHTLEDLNYFRESLLTIISSSTNE